MYSVVESVTSTAEKFDSCQIIRVFFILSSSDGVTGLRMGSGFQTAFKRLCKTATAISHATCFIVRV